MKNKIEEFIELQEELTSKLEKWVKDKSIPVDERWEVFIMAGLGNHQEWIAKPHPYFDTYILDLYRYKTVFSENVLDQLINSLCDKEEVMDEEDLTDKSKQEIIDFKEAVLEKFLYSFILDW